MTTIEPVRYLLRFQGLVQGVGFRPFLFGLASQYELAGFVANTSEGVVLEIEGRIERIEAFRAAVIQRLPPHARISDVAIHRIAPQGSSVFEIRSSHLSGGRTAIPADLAICSDCRNEMHDGGDRRFGHPFISCTNCGPRFTIIKALPYDRSRTSMANFPMCDNCRAEYIDPTSRRFHAQTVACPECGPTVGWTANGAGDTQVTNPVGAARKALRSGQIVAIKGIGGYHIACDATNDKSVNLLRTRKGRGDKPFAIMVPTIERAAELVELDDQVIRALSDARGLVVLATRRRDHPDVLARGVAPDARELGIMLPYSPLHELLFLKNRGKCALHSLVMTSGNLSGEPIVIDNGVAVEQLAGLVDGWLQHDRDILVPCDDSVVRCFGGELLPVRRSRGFAPLPIGLGVDMPPTLALGGDVKTCVGIAAGGQAWMSSHVGDMARGVTFETLSGVVKHLEILLGVEVERLVVDEHPAYRTVLWAEQEARGRPVVKVQHHHAHIASLLTESGYVGSDPVLGFTFDGAGYGSDGSIWGGEVLLATLARWQRVGSMRQVWQPGGDAAVRHPYRMALSHLASANIPWTTDLPPVHACQDGEEGVIRRQVLTGLTSIRTSSMGRLFDAVSSLTGVCQTADYEAEAAMRFEALARCSPDPDVAYAFGVEEKSGLMIARPEPVIRSVVDDLRKGVSIPEIAARFHIAVAELVTDMASRLRTRYDVNTVGLTGGVFLNALLTELTQQRLVAAGFEVLRHKLVPPSDAGLALGQIAIAGARDR